LINCPNCREGLNWPTLQKVKAFPKQRGDYQEQEEIEEDEEASPRKKKTDPWLTGCLGLIVIVVLILAGYKVYDMTSQKTLPTLPSQPVSDNQTSLQPMQIPECRLQWVASIIVPGAPI